MGGSIPVTDSVSRPHVKQANGSARMRTAAGGALADYPALHVVTKSVYIISLFPHRHTPFPPFSPSLISLMVSVDVKHPVYLLTVLTVASEYAFPIAVGKRIRPGRIMPTSRQWSLSSCDQLLFPPLNGIKKYLT